MRVARCMGSFCRKDGKILKCERVYVGVGQRGANRLPREVGIGEIQHVVHVLKLGSIVHGGHPSCMGSAPRVATRGILGESFGTAIPFRG